MFFLFFLYYVHISCVGMLTQVRGAEGFRLSMQQQQARHKYDIWPIFAKSEGVTATLAPLVSMPMHTYMGASTIIQEVYFVFLDAHQLQYFCCMSCTFC